MGQGFCVFNKHSSWIIFSVILGNIEGNHTRISSFNKIIQTWKPEARNWISVVLWTVDFLNLWLTLTAFLSWCLIPYLPFFIWELFLSIFSWPISTFFVNWFVCSFKQSVLAQPDYNLHKIRKLLWLFHYCLLSF